MTAPRTIIFAGGGTGGHIVPALAIADACRTLAGADPSVRTVHIGGQREIDRRMHAEALRTTASDDPGDGPHGSADAVYHIPAKPFSLRPKGLLKLVGSWGVCVRTVRAIIREERERSASLKLVAMGGYIAAPAVQAARAEGCPVVLVNLDAVAGLANRWIARRADERFSVGSAPAQSNLPGWSVVNPIVKPSFDAAPAPEQARLAFGLEPDRPTLLITGGSQGARSINGFIARLLERDSEAFQGWQVIHQTGDDEHNPPEFLGRLYSAHGVRAHIDRFMTDMPSAWFAADAAVGRAGAGTVAEAWATSTPTLFFPYTFHKDGHQRLNVEPLQRAGAALIATDHVDVEQNLEHNRETLLGLLTAPEARSAMRDALEGLGAADGAATIARALLGPSADVQG